MGGPFEGASMNPARSFGPDLAEQRSNGAWERLGRQDELGESPTVAFTRLRREMLAAERATFVRFRDMGRIDEDVLREMLRELDYEEAMLDR